MSNLKTDLIEIVDNYSGEVLIEKLEERISKIIPYQHETANIFDSIGLNMFTPVITLKGNPSRVVEQLENQFSKRQLAFVCLDILQNSAENAQSVQVFPNKFETWLKIMISSE